MSRLHFFVSLLTFASCTNKDYIELAQLSTIHESYTFNDTALIKVSSSTKFISPEIEVQIDSALDISSHYLALVKFDFPGMESGHGRPYELALLQHNIDTATYNMLITIDKLSNKLIDILMFDANKSKLKALYPVSSPEYHDAIAVELLEDQSNSNRIDITLHRLDVSNKGFIQYKHTVSDLEMIFFGLNDICKQCGIYTRTDKKLSVKFEIRQGLKPESLAYLFVLTSPAECSEHYVGFDGKFVNGVMPINDHIKMELTQNQLSVKIKDYKNGCDEMQPGGDFNLQSMQ